MSVTLEIRCGLCDRQAPVLDRKVRVVATEPALGSLLGLHLVTLKRADWFVSSAGDVLCPRCKPGGKR